MISVTLFLLAINDITKHLISPVKCTIFADGVTLFIKGKNLQTSQKIMQKTLNSLVRYTNTSGLKFSVKKIQAIIFEKTRRENHNIHLHIEGEKIELANTIKILGLTFDKKLTWENHIENLKCQCLLRLNTLKTLAAKNWGANQKILTNAYQAIIQSKLDYGCAAYGSATESRLKKLNTIINASMRIATGAYRTSPIASILSESNIIPLELRREKLILN